MKPFTWSGKLKLEFSDKDLVIMEKKYLYIINGKNFK